MLLPLFHPYLPFPPKPLLLPKPFPTKILCASSSSKIHTAPSQEAALPKSAIQRIAEKLRALGYTEEKNQLKETPLEPASELTSDGVGKIFIPLPQHLPKHRVGYTIDSSWSTPENPVPEPGSCLTTKKVRELSRVVESKRYKGKGENGSEKVPSLAELKLSGEELRRLRDIGIRIRKKLKLGKAGITEGIVNGIHERWRRTEVVKIACEDICKLNMKRTHDLLERKTGGLVVWRSGSNIILYRGADYKYPYFSLNGVATNDNSPKALLSTVKNNGEISVDESLPSSIVGDRSGGQKGNKMAEASLVYGLGVQNRVRFLLPGEAQLVEEADGLLEGLGPRFNDWWGYEPLPIDGDLLPAVVPGYRRPFRLLPYGVKPKLTNDEMTILRRLARPIPCHFALGRNRNLQGLAASIIKLWEKCEIAKIAVKRGVQNTNSEQMAEELKSLTGGTLLARDREFIVFYRGKDFLPQAVSSAIAERRNKSITVEKKEKNPVASATAIVVSEVGVNHCKDDIPEPDNGARIPPTEHVKTKSKEAAIRKTGIKLSLTIKKKERAEKLLQELDAAEVSQQPEVDKEGITEEERYMLRKVGLRMKPFLLLGRRGVFDGTVENMHLHWKYRELVKIISKERSIDDVYPTARTLEAESGGVLVAVERVNKGYAIIVYRGKNYIRPASLRPKSLLSKKQAMKRSLEAQRRQSLKLHLLKLERSVDELELELAQEKEVSSKPSIHEMSESSSRLLDQSEDNESKLVQPVYDDSKLHLVGQQLLSDSVDTISVDSISSETLHREEEMDMLSKNPIETDDCDAVSLSGFGLMESAVKSQDETIDSTFDSHRFLANYSVVNNADPQSSDKDQVAPIKSTEKEIISSIPADGKNMTDRILSTATTLSNKERLLLRRQALKMRKRPVLAVGKSNVVSGVAKTIKTHFEKHPLAIVNVKGRAKGTSIQELIFKLEQATGAVLVSQEPNKVILYRGWGADDESGHGSANNIRGSRGKLESGEDKSRTSVSPELVAAIKLECGLQTSRKTEGCLH